MAGLVINVLFKKLLSPLQLVYRGKNLQCGNENGFNKSYEPQNWSQVTKTGVVLPVLNFKIKQMSRNFRSNVIVSFE